MLFHKEKPPNQRRPAWSGSSKGATPERGEESYFQRAARRRLDLGSTLCAGVRRGRGDRIAVNNRDSVQSLLRVQVAGRKPEKDYPPFSGTSGWKARKEGGGKGVELEEETLGGEPPRKETKY